MKIYTFVENKPQSFRRSLRMLYSAFTLSILILTILSIIFISQLNKVVEYSDEVDKTNGLLYKLEKLELTVVDAESSQRGYILTHNSQMLNDYELKKRQVNPLLDSIYFLSDATIKRKTDDLRTIINKRLDFLESNLEKYLSGDTTNLAEGLNQGRAVMEQASQKIEEIEVEQRDLLHEGYVNQARYEGNAPLYFAIIILVAGIINLVSFLTIMYELKKRKIYQQELENKVMELKQHTEELEQFAFVASHNMQEPLRKIRTFSDRLKTKHSPDLDEEGQLIVGRINDNSIRLHEIINEMVGFTNLVRNTEELETVDVRKVLNEVRQEFAELISERNASIDVNNPGIINGYPKQINLLMKALIENSIKFSKPGEAPRIIISGEEIDSKELKNGTVLPGERSFWRIKVEDNGIGFENQYAEKVFKLFQKLSNDAEGGKGVGLALVSRVMINHHGFAIAESEPGEGVRVYLYFPISS